MNTLFSQMKFFLAGKRISGGSEGQNIPVFPKRRENVKDHDFLLEKYAREQVQSVASGLCERLHV